MLRRFVVVLVFELDLFVVGNSSIHGYYPIRAHNIPGFVRGFWLSPRRYPDLGWAWLTRFLINLSNALV